MSSKHPDMYTYYNESPVGRGLFESSIHEKILSILKSKGTRTILSFYYRSIPPEVDNAVRKFRQGYRGNKPSPEVGRTIRESVVIREKFFTEYLTIHLPGPKGPHQFLKLDEKATVPRIHFTAVTQYLGKPDRYLSEEDNSNGWKCLEYLLWGDGNTEFLRIYYNDKGIVTKIEQCDPKEQ